MVCENEKVIMDSVIPILKMRQAANEMVSVIIAKTFHASH